MLANANLVTYSRFDSIRAKFNVSADSFHGQYRNMIADFNAETKRINQTIDSLERLTLPTKKYEKKLGELSNSKRKAEARLLLPTPAAL